MGTEVEPTSGNIQATVTIPSSTTSTSGPKMSMFAKKSGFVIPKNKLSGSLVPVFRGPKKGDADLMNEDATNQVQRKTKWGPDLTMDATVRKGRALAYQTRINQISQQLTLGTLELEDNEALLSTAEFQPGKTSDHQLSKQDLEQLEFERREIMGEILKLNPAYKAPADYKPLLKEAKVPIPIKEYPGYNFIGLVFGPASDTQKRLEKETGAKIRVYGTKADTGAKIEITPTDGKENENVYEDMYVHVSADTFEKIDAAVALIELLVTPVSVNPVPSSATSTTVSDDSASAHSSKSMPSSITAPALVNQGTAQLYPGSLLPPQGQFQQYPQAWFSAGPTQTRTYQQSGLISPANSSAPLLGNTIHVSPSSFNPASMPSLFGPRPVIPASFSPILQNPPISSRPQLSHASQPAYMQQAPPLGQSGGPRNTPVPMTPPIVQHNAMASQNMVSSGAPLVSIPNNMVSPLSGPSQSAGPVAGQQPRGGFSPLLPSAGSEPTPSTVQPAMPQAAMRAPPSNAIPGPGLMPFQVQSSANFDSMKPPSAAIPRPQQPSSSDFTFQPHHRPPPNATASQVPWQGSQPAHHNIRPPVQAGHAPLAPQPGLMRSVAHNLNPAPVQGFPRPLVSHPVNPPRVPIPTNFAGPPTFPPVASRHLGLPGHNPVASATAPHMQPRNFIPPHPINNSSSPFPPRPGSQMHIQENNMRPQRFPTPHQHVGSHPGRPFPGSSVAQQVYDPFSPTAAPFNPQMGGNAARGAQTESDPEYEDLMASVGVK